MSNWQEFREKEGRLSVWPYPIRYEKEQEIETDILVLGGGIAGCWAAISAARKGVRVTLVEKSATVRSGQGGPGCDNWCDVPTDPLIKINPDEWAQRRTGHNGGYNCGIGRQNTMPRVLRYASGDGEDGRENRDTMIRTWVPRAEMKKPNSWFIEGLARFPR